MVDRGLARPSVDTTNDQQHVVFQQLSADRLVYEFWVVRTATVAEYNRHHVVVRVIMATQVG